MEPRQPYIHLYMPREGIMEFDILVAALTWPLAES